MNFLVIKHHYLVEAFFLKNIQYELKDFKSERLCVLCVHFIIIMNQSTTMPPKYRKHHDRQFLSSEQTTTSVLVNYYYKYFFKFYYDHILAIHFVLIILTWIYLQSQSKATPLRVQWSVFWLLRSRSEKM